MNSLLRALRAEVLKLRRTLALWMVGAAPVVVVVLQFFLLYDRGRFPAGTDGWSLFVRSTLSLWGVFMLPLFIALETALLNGLEHSSHSWKHLYALPIPRWSVCGAKFVTAHILVVAATFFVVAGILVSGRVLGALRPELGFAAAIPWWDTAKAALLIYCASWLILGLQTWISMRWASFPLALGVGIGGTFFALFASSAKAGKFYPWLLPVNVLSPERMSLALVLGIGGGILVTAFGVMEVLRRDVL